MHTQINYKQQYSGIICTKYTKGIFLFDNEYTKIEAESNDTLPHKLRLKFGQVKFPLYCILSVRKYHLFIPGIPSPSHYAATHKIKGWQTRLPLQRQVSVAVKRGNLMWTEPWMANLPSA